MGDLDGDQDVDLDDYTIFESAMNGPDQAGGNLDADFDTDGDVDLADFGTFAEALASGGGADYALVDGTLTFDPGAEGFVAGRRHFPQHQPAGLSRRQLPAQWRGHHAGHQLPIDFGRQLPERRAQRGRPQD